MNKIRLLLIGAGDSGKSTFIKQIKVIVNTGFSHNELQVFKTVIRDNVIETMKNIIEYAKNNQFQFNQKLDNYVQKVILSKNLMDEGCGEAIQKLWRNKKLKKFVKINEDNMTLYSSYEYLLNKVNDYLEVDFKPNQDDIMRVKLKTTGIIENEFNFNQHEFILIDVGGQRTERRKWLHCFEDINCVMYMAALDEYNLPLVEDPSQNRMDESLQLFAEISQSRWLINKNIVVFLNKSDILKEKIATRPLGNFFEDFPPENNTDFDFSINYIREKYENAYAGKGAVIYHITCALETSVCETVFNSVRDFVIREALEQSNLGFGN